MHTWKTLGADTRDARAEDKVAAKIPAVIKGAHPDIIAITWGITCYNIT